MKRIILLAIILLPMLAFAGHLAFMGIPLTGTIENFSLKLKQKGVKTDPSTKKLPSGVRSFTGTFIGKDASIYVYYDTKSKSVYRAKACIENHSKEQAERLLGEVKEMLGNKYFTLCEDGTQEGFNSTSLVVFPEPTETAIATGVINLYISKVDGYRWPFDDIYVLHIDYQDFKSTDKNTISMMDDL